MVNKHAMVSETAIWQWLEEVADPEIPVLSVVDLGMIRKVVVNGMHTIIVITPTYTGCPAVQTIEEDIKQLLHSKGVKKIAIQQTLSPAWTTDWISDSGRAKLKKYGIAPPEHETDKHILFASTPIVKCPKCHSANTHMISLFGSTACKALYKCNDCYEPFDYFKCLK